MDETALENLQAWLSTYPRWEACPVDICALPNKMEELSRRKDILGNTLVENRCYVNLVWEMPALESKGENAERMLKFLQWIQFQSASGFAPQFGDVPAREIIRSEKSGFTPGAQFVTYTVTLVVDFVKAYEAE